MRIGAPARWLVAVLAAGAPLVAAQAPPAARSFRSAIDLTTVTATVLDQDGRIVTGLSRDAFEVLDDGQPQVITQFTGERVPVSLGILLDISDSMFGQRINDARDALAGFVRDRLESRDEFALLAFNHAQHLLSGWTGDRGAAAGLMQPLRPSGATAIYDAITTMLPLIEGRARQRGAIVVISDGADTASDASLRDVRAAMLRSDVFVYAVGIDPPARRPINGAVNPLALHQITDQSGGRTLIVHDSAAAASALAEIAGELNGQYLIGYDSPHQPDGQYHSIRVRVRDAGLRVRARSGYVAGGTPPAPATRSRPRR